MSQISPDQYLANILNKYAPSDNTKAASGMLHNPLCLWAGDDLNAIWLFGSSQKGTAIAGKSDLDLFVSIKASCRFSIADIYKSLLERLTQLGYSPRRQDVSIGITVDGKNVDIVPAKLQTGSAQFHILHRSKTGSWTQTNIHKQVEEVIRANKRNEIKLTKIWRELNKLSFPSFYLELFVIEALKSSRKVSLADRFNDVLLYLSNEFERTRIVDPSNTANIFFNDPTTTEKSAIASRAREACKASSWNGVVY